MPNSVILRLSTVVASRCVNVVAGAGSVKSSAGTYTACTEVMEPFFVDVIRSCICPISEASVADSHGRGMRPNRADTSEPAWVKRKILSMKNRMSRGPSPLLLSRKDSAKVRPESATEERAPGVRSFVRTPWPLVIFPLRSCPLSRGPSVRLPCFSGIRRRT